MATTTINRLSKIGIVSQFKDKFILEKKDQVITIRIDNISYRTRFLKYFIDDKGFKTISDVIEYLNPKEEEENKKDFLSFFVTTELKAMRVDLKKTTTEYYIVCFKEIQATLLAEEIPKRFEGFQVNWEYNPKDRIYKIMRTRKGM